MLHPRHVKMSWSLRGKSSGNRTPLLQSSKKGGAAQLQSIQSRSILELTVALSIKIDKKRKQDLERFVASLKLDEGVKITLQEALALMLDYSLENKDEIIKRLKKLPPLEQDPLWKAMKPDD